MNDSLLLDIDKLLDSEIGSSCIEKINYQPRFSQDDFILSRAIKGTIELIRLNEKILAKFNLIVEPILQCSRCLGDFKNTARIATVREYSTQNEPIDVWPAIREEIILSIPMKPLCDEKCKGIKIKQFPNPR